jgi:hypothetical protein
MLEKEICLRAIKTFRAKQALDTTDENVIASIHLMNAHGSDVNTALDQSSRSGNDSGIDAWYYDELNGGLFVYQSKLRESKAQALQGLEDLDRGREWLEKVIIDGTVEHVPSDNHCLFNLYTRLSAVRARVRTVHFILISLFDQDELEDSAEYRDFEREIQKSRLNGFMRQNQNGSLAIRAIQYNLEQRVPANVKVYPIPKIPESRVSLRKNAHLDLAYVSLHSLVELYRQRGDILFDKNVRLSLSKTKEARERLVYPMAATLDLITTGKLSPSIFSFYHTGVTIAASSLASDDTNLLNLEAPSIINGCQTITITSDYLKNLERQKNEAAIDLFKQIRVVAKVVVGTTNDELKEITNSNNRQNPIENWQLFSNEPIHIEIEAALKDIGVFYERQKGKFDSVMKNADNAKHYYHTNGTYIRVLDLGQMIALARQTLQWAAKPSEIFLNKENHDKIFDREIPKYPRDTVFVWNLYKAMKRGLNKYMELPAHANSYAPMIFRNQIVRAHVFYLGLLHFYQHPNRQSARTDFSTSLCKKANPRLVDELHGFYQKIVNRIKTWYTEESKQLTVPIGKKKLDAFFGNLATELGVDVEGDVPFSETSIDWSEYQLA